MADVVVPTDELRNVAHLLRDLADQLRARVASLDHDVAAVVGGSWSGEAASAYGGAWRTWHVGAGEVTGGLTAMAALFEKSVASYVHTDDRGAVEIARVEPE